MKALVTRYPVLLIIAVAIISRIPFMLGPSFFLDGDECIVGLMARLMQEGKNFSWFFWGQNYGLSVFETTFIIPFYLLLGYTTLAVKLGVFSLWLVGVVFLYKALLVITGRNITAALAVAVFFILFPAWGSWCMKATGGYITAFLLSNILLYLSFDKNIEKGFGFFIIAGALLELVFESQRLWLVGLMPLVIYTLRRDWSVAKVIVMLTTVASIWLYFHDYKQNMQVVHITPITFPSSEKMQWYITRFPDYLYNSFCGDYYFNQYPEHDVFISLMSYAGCIIFFGLFILGLYHLFTKKKDYLFLVSLVFMLATYGYSFFAYLMEGRYLLSVSGFLCVPLALFIKDFTNHRLFRSIVIILTIIGIGSCIGFYKFYETSREYKQDVLTTVRYLEKEKVKAAYSTDYMLPYQVMFYSDLKIYSRAPAEPARYQPLSNAADSAFFHKEKIAVLVYQGIDLDMEMKYDKKMAHIWICTNPPIEAIWKGFDFYHPKASN